MDLVISQTNIVFVGQFCNRRFANLLANEGA